MGEVLLKKWIAAFLVIVMLVWAIVDFMIGKEDVHQETKNVGLMIGDLAPNFELKTLAGETVELSDYRGQTVMLNFWATWCPPCRAEMPDMQDFYQDSEVQVLAINLTSSENTIEDVIQFKEEYGLSFPILLDDKNVVGDRYQIRPMPTSYMVDASGVIQFIMYGALNYDQMMLEYEKIK